MFALVLALVAGEMPVVDPQPPDARAVVRTLIDQVEGGKPVDNNPVYRLPAREALAELKPYLTTGSDRVRFSVVGLVRVVGFHSDEPAIRKEAVKLLMEYAGREKDTGKVRWTLESLSEFGTSDFDDRAKEQIRDFVREKSPHGEAFLLAGAAKVEAVKKELRKWAESDNGEKFLLGDRSWQANLALAKMGDAGAARFCVEKLEEAKDIAQRVRRFPDLAYTRHPVAVKYLTRQLMSEERLPPLRKGDPGSRVAVYALAALAGIIEKFPIKGLGPDYNDAQLATARGWVNDQKNLTIKP